VIAHITEAIKLNTDNPEAWNLRAVASVRKGNYNAEAVLRDLQKALELKPDFEAAQKNLDYIQALEKGENPRYVFPGLDW
jgi:Flp pilus assembly protein TadD